MDVKVIIYISMLYCIAIGYQQAAFFWQLNFNAVMYEHAP